MYNRHEVGLMNKPGSSIWYSTLDRRFLLAGGLGFLACSAFGSEEQKEEPLLDIHVHLFGVGEGGTKCRISPSVTRGLQFTLLVGALGLRSTDATLDEMYERVLVKQLKESRLSKAAILGQDAVYDHLGQ